MAIVLSYDAPRSARRCVESLLSQQTPLDRVLVVDNGGPTPVDLSLGDDPAVEVLRLEHNWGPAGGHAAGLRSFLESDADIAWLFDDDCVAAVDATGALLAEVEAHPADCVIFAHAVDADTGTPLLTQGWCGVAVPRSVIEQVGLPDTRLFWWAEDTEYLQWRIPQNGHPVVRSTTADVSVRRARADGSKPAWKYYYETRNQVHYRLRVQQPPADGPVPWHLTRRVRLQRAARSTYKLAARAVVRERSGRAAKLLMVGRGLVDGLAGRLGERVSPTSSHRPSDPHPPEIVSRIEGTVG